MDDRTTVRNEPIRPTPRFFPQNVSSTAVGLSGVTAEFLNSNKLNFAWLTSSAAIRYRWDGSSPTTAVGHVLPANTPLQLTGRRKILSFVFIGDAGGAAILSVTLDHTSDAGGLQ